MSDPLGLDDEDASYLDGSCPDCHVGPDEACTDECECDECNQADEDDDEGEV